MQGNREKQDEKDAEPEVGNRNADQREQGRRDVGVRPDARSGAHAESDADHDRNRQRQIAERKGDCSLSAISAATGTP